MTKKDIIYISLAVGGLTGGQMGGVTVAYKTFLEPEVLKTCASLADSVVLNYEMYFVELEERIANLEQNN